MTGRAWTRRWGRLVATALALRAGAVRAAPAGAEPPATVLGRVCLDRGADGRCDPGDPPLSGIEVRTLRGQRVRTDEAGRYRLPVIGARVRALDTAGRLRPRLTHLRVVAEVGPLGLPAAEAPGRWVDLLPGATLRADLPVPISPLRPGSLPRVGRATGALPHGAGRAGHLVLRVPVEVRGGHRLLLGGRPLQAGAEGRVWVDLPLTGREVRRTVLDLAPDGTLQVFGLRGVRVPWEEGADLLAHRAPRLLLTLRLPASGRAAPGRLWVPLAGPPGTKVWVDGAEPVVLDANGSGALWVTIGGDPISLGVRMPRGREVRIPLPLRSDPRLGRRLRGALSLRAGAGGGLFGEGTLDLEGRLPLFGGALEGGLRLDDGALLRGLEIGRPVVLSEGAIYERWPDPDIAGLGLADGAHVEDEDPSGATVWGGWRGPAGEAVLGAGRLPLAGPEVGRLDRATLGAVVDLAARVGTGRLRLEAAGDGWALPLYEDPEVLPGHAEIEATGGAFYRLPHRAIAEGSERLWVEVLDPASGLPLSRRRLERGRDYEVDYESGDLLLAAPLGLTAMAPAGRSTEPRLGLPVRLIADYHYRAPAPGRGYAAGGARLSFEGRWLHAGVQAAGVSAGRYGLVAADLVVDPVPWLSLSGSVARSAGDPFVGAQGAMRSADGGERYTEAAGVPARDGALAFALRLRLGDETGPVVAHAFGRLRGRGFADGTGVAATDERALGLRLRLGGPAAGLTLGAGAAHEPGLEGGGERERAEVRLRGHLEVGRLGLALEGGYESITDRPEDAAEVSGGRALAGAEFSYRVGERLTVLAAHAQGLWRGGAGPAAEDPTFTSVGARARLPWAGTVEARVGVHPDGRPGLRLAWLAEPSEGRTRWARFGVETDRPWDGQGHTSVVGGRQRVDPHTDLYAESRATEGEGGGLEVGRAVGGRLGRGPLFLTLAWERAARPGVTRLRLREGAHARLGWRGERLSASIFGERTRAYGLGAGEGLGGRVVAGGRVLWAPVDGLEVAGRALARWGFDLGEAGVQPRLDLATTFTYRPRAGLLSLARAHYGLRADPRPDRAALWHRIQVGRASVGLGRAPGPTATLALALAADEARAPAVDLDEGGRALVASLRLSWPIAARVEPVLELGLRRLWGAGADALAPTLRVEALALLGAVRVGLGVVVAGFSGQGTEPVTGEPAAPRIYLVLRAAR